jgi:hypothetical protein
MWCEIIMKGEMVKIWKVWSCPSSRLSSPFPEEMEKHKTKPLKIGDIPVEILTGFSQWQAWSVSVASACSVHLF